MKKNLLYTAIPAAALSALLASPPAFAHDGGERQAKKIAKVQARILERFDENADGMVALEEFQAVLNAQFAKADANNDNLLNAEEMQQQIGVLMSEYRHKRDKKRGFWFWRNDNRDTTQPEAD